MARVTVAVLVSACLISSVIAYENVYDIIERRNQRRYYSEPDHRYFETGRRILNRYDDYDRFPSYNTRSYGVYSNRRSIDPDKYRIVSFGNGYDNLGNGLLTNKDYFIGEIPYSRKSRRDYLSDSWYRPRIFYNKNFVVSPRHGESSFSDEKSNINKNYESSSNERGKSAVSSIDSIIENNEDNKQRKTNENYKSNQVSVQDNLSNRENFGEKSHVDRSGENKSIRQSNRISKKGHVTKGFSTHHHKDETGNSTTFYDEFSDHGDHSDFKGVDDGFGTRKIMEQVGNAENGKSFRESGGQRGNFGSGYIKDNSKVEKDILSNSNHFERDDKFHLAGEDEHLGRGRNAYHHGGSNYDHGLPSDNFIYF